jgi:hypothetical protein
LGCYRNPCNNDQGEFLNGYERLIGGSDCSMLATANPTKL